jgi:RNA polymerase sigma-70 factor (ECF subfamily)
MTSDAPPGLDEDQALVERSRAGDARAFDELARKYDEPLRRLVRRYVKNDDDAKDVSQRALLQAFEKLSTFRGESAFRTWLFRIGIHLALNHVRGAKRMQPIELDDIAAFTSTLETGKLVAAELWRKVEARLAELPPKQRLAVELRLFHELSFKEVADVAGVSEESAKANFHHGVKRLRGVIQGV